LTKCPSIRRLRRPDNHPADRIRPICLGDCDGDHTVSVDELVEGIDITLGNDHVESCRAFDRDEDGQVAIYELTQAVNNALNGCFGVAVCTNGVRDDTGTRCAGDCNLDCRVTEGEANICWDIFLADRPLDECPACDTDDNGIVTVSELNRAMANVENPPCAANP